VVALAVVLTAIFVALYLVARRGGDESAIGLLPDDRTVSAAWPGATISGRQSWDVHQLFEQEAVVMGIRLADKTGLSINARDYASPARAWFAAKAFSPKGNWFYWDYPGRHRPDGSELDGLPPGSTLVGFLCTDGRYSPRGCQLWILWWKRGRGIWEVKWSPRGLGPEAFAPTAKAVEVMSPLWQR